MFAPRLRLIFMVAMFIATTSLLSLACGDDEGPAQTAGTAGNGGQGGQPGGTQEVGGFAAGPVGGGPGNGGGGMNEGGTGTLTYQWGNVIGGSGTIVPRDVAIDNAGNIIVVGAYTGMVDFGGGPLPVGVNNDIFIVKLDSMGGHVWSAGYGDGQEQGALSVATDSANNIIITGPFRGTFTIGMGGMSISSVDSQFSDVYVAKVDADGNQVFADVYAIGDAKNDSGNAVATDASGNIIVGGRFQTSIDFGGGALMASGGAGDQAMFLAKFDQNGGFQYQQSFGDGASQEIWAVAGGQAGVFALGGVSPGDINFGGGNIANAAGARAVVAKFDGTNNHVFSALLTGDGDSRVNGLTFQNDGSLIAAGNFKTSIDAGDGPMAGVGAADDIFVVQYSTNGDVVYATTFGDQNSDQVADVAVDDMGFAYVAGSFQGSLPVNSMTTLSSSAQVQDAYLLRVGPAGNGFAGVQTTGDTSVQGAGVAVDNGDGSVVYVGSVTGMVDLGDGMMRQGTADLFVAKFTP